MGSTTAVKEPPTTRPYQTNFAIKGPVSPQTTAPLACMTERCRCDPAAAALLVALFGHRTAVGPSSGACFCNQLANGESTEAPTAAATTSSTASFDCIAEPLQSPPTETEWLRLTVSKQPGLAAATKREPLLEDVQVESYHVTARGGDQSPEPSLHTHRRAEQFTRMVLHPLQCEGLLQPYFIDELCVPSIRQFLADQLDGERLQPNQIIPSELLLPRVPIPVNLALYASDTNDFEVMEIPQGIAVAHVTLNRGAEGQDLLAGEVFYPHNSQKVPLRMMEGEEGSLVDSLRLAVFGAQYPADTVKLVGYFQDPSTRTSSPDEVCCVMPSTPFVVTDLLSLNGMDVGHYAAQERRRLLGMSLCEVGERVVIAHTFPLTSTTVEAARKLQHRTSGCTTLILRDRLSQFPSPAQWRTSSRGVGVLEFLQEGSIVATPDADARLKPEPIVSPHPETAKTAQLCLAVCGVEPKSSNAVFGNEVTLRPRDRSKWRPAVRAFVDDATAETIRVLLQAVVSSGIEEAAVVARISLTLPAQKTSSMFTGVLSPESVTQVRHQRDVATDDELQRAVEWGKYAPNEEAVQSACDPHPVVQRMRAFSAGEAPELLCSRWAKLKGLLGNDLLANAHWIESAASINGEPSISLVTRPAHSLGDRAPIILQRTNGGATWLFPPIQFFGRRLSSVVLCPRTTAPSKTPNLDPVQFEVWIKRKAEAWLRADVGPGPDSSADRLFFSPLEGEDSAGARKRYGTFSSFCDAFVYFLEPAFYAAMTTDIMRDYVESMAKRPTDVRHEFWKNLHRFLSDAVLYVYEQREDEQRGDIIADSSSPAGVLNPQIVAKNWRRALEDNREPAETALANVAFTP